MRPIEILPEAYEELESAKHWYEEKSMGLGNRFINEIEKAIILIREEPETWPAYLYGTRRFVIHRFPFGVVYRYQKNTIQIIAFMHLRRKPGYWCKRK